MAAENGHLMVVKTLLAYNAKPDFVNSVSVIIGLTSTSVGIQCDQMTHIDNENPCHTVLLCNQQFVILLSYGVLLFSCLLISAVHSCLQFMC